MTDIELHQPAHPSVPALAPLGAAEMELMVRQAELLAASSIIPTAYREKPANVFVAALTGRTFGWDAITAMRNGHVIEGVWSIKPEAMLALIRRAGHSVSGSTSAESATVTGKRCDDGVEMTVTFTVADAVRAGLCQLKDGKPYARSDKGKVKPWEAYPQAMCWARAVSALARMLFADVVLGLSYTPEELGADVDADGAVIEASWAPAAAQLPEPLPQEVAVDLSDRLNRLGPEARTDFFEHFGKRRPRDLTADEEAAAQAYTTELEAAAEVVDAEVVEEPDATKVPAEADITGELDHLLDQLGEHQRTAVQAFVDSQPVVDENPSRATVLEAIRKAEALRSHTGPIDTEPQPVDEEVTS